MRTLILLLTCCFAAHVLHAQTIARFVVESGKYSRTNIPVSCEVTFSESDILQLQEVKGTRRIPVAFQSGPHQIFWLLDGTNKPGSQRIFELIKIDPQKLAAVQQIRIPPAMLVIDSSGSLILQDHNHHLLQYNYATVNPPKGVDSIYKRSGFIHPLWSPNGQVLTNIHPKDHWHHVGIWNPWTHTQFEGKETDFWNLQKKEGTVRFISFLSQTQGDIWCGFKALQDHVALISNKNVAQGNLPSERTAQDLPSEKTAQDNLPSERTALHEIWDIRAYSCGSDTTRRIWDFNSNLSCASSPIELLQYRYGGGFAFRATADWNATNSKVLTSEGKTRINADSTRSRWIKITGNTKAGILVLCAPDNYDFPQPLRVWPENTERGEIMLNYSPTKMKPWNLEYGKEYRQRYRIMVYENDITVAEAENAWQAFAHPPVVRVTAVF